MPSYVDVLGGTTSQVGMVMGWFTLAAVVVRPYFGQLADRRGRKRLMVGGAGCFVIFFLLYQQVTNIAVLYLLRAGHGLAHACFMAASSAYIADLAPAERRGEVIGIYGTASVVAMALFPALGTAVIQGTGDFGFLFRIAALTAGLALLAVLFLDEISAAGGKPGAGTGLLAVGRRRSVWAPSVVLFGGATAYGAVITFLPLFAPQRGVADFGIFFIAYAASTILSRVLAGRLSDKIGRVKVIIPFTLLVALAVAMLPFLHSREGLLLIGCIFGLGFGAFMPTLNALVVDRTTPQERGSALGFFTSFMDLGITAGAVLLGLIGEKFEYAVVFGLAAGVVVLGLLIFAFSMRAGCEQASR